MTYTTFNIKVYDRWIPCSIKNVINNFVRFDVTWFVLGEFCLSLTVSRKEFSD